MKLRVILPTVWFAVCVAASTQAKPEEVAPECAHANFARPVVLAPDDVRAFPEWTGYVHADSVLDGLIADGKAVPMIVVMPNGRALPDDRPPPPDKIYTPENAAGFAYHFAQRLFR